MTYLKSSDKSFSTQGKAFTTKPKLRRISWHKQQTVRNRAYALQESFYPTSDVHYEAVKVRMGTLLGICDRISVLNYLGRPECKQTQVMDHSVKYNKSGKLIDKTHYFRKKLKAKKGYIELFGLGYVYTVESEWFIHWNHTEQLTLASIDAKVQSSPAPPLKRETIMNVLLNLATTLLTFPK